MIKMPGMSPSAEEARTLFPSGRGTGGAWYFCDPPPCCRLSMTSFFLACCRDQSACHLCIVHCLHVHAAPTFWLRSTLQSLLALPTVFPLLFLRSTHIPCVSPGRCLHQQHGSVPMDQKHEPFGAKIFCSALGKSHTGVAEWKPFLFCLVTP